jgi:hypothetical protein
MYHCFLCDLGVTYSIPKDQPKPKQDHMSQKPIPSVAEIRVLNLIRLMNEKFDGRQSNLSRAIERKPDYIWRVLNRKKGFGETLARDIEKLLALPDKWLDDAANSTSSGGIPVAQSRIVMVLPYATKGKIEEESIPLRVERLLLNSESEANLSFVVMDDQAMSLSIPKGDEVVINTVITTPIDGQLFFIRHGNATKVRRLTLDAHEKWVIRCDTTDKMRYPDVIVPEAELRIIGQVVWAGGRR